MPCIDRKELFATRYSNYRREFAQKSPNYTRTGRLERQKIKLKKSEFFCLTRLKVKIKFKVVRGGILIKRDRGL